MFGYINIEQIKNIENLMFSTQFLSNSYVLTSILAFKSAMLKPFLPDTLNLREQILEGIISKINGSFSFENLKMGKDTVHLNLLADILKGLSTAFLALSKRCRATLY